MGSHFDQYLLKLRETPIAEHTEHTGRAALQALLNAFAAEAGGGRIAIQHEPKRDSGKGAPDFKISRSGMILGYVEVKEIGTNLEKVRKSPQIKKYLELSGNILLTDYLQWMWLGPDGAVKGQETLAYASDLEGRTVRVREDRAEQVAKIIAGFFSTPPEGIGRAQTLALALATRSRLLREYLGEELVRQAQEHTEGRLHGLYDIFKRQVFHELALGEFADAFAQMLAYGLFLARLNSGTATITLENARQFVPHAFELIRELVDFLGELQKAEYRDVRWVVEEVLSIVNGLDLTAIHHDLSFRQRKAISRGVRAEDEQEHRLFERDPFIYFYEDFLKAYDPATRKGRGVYYTPPPVVNFIVRAIDDILKDPEIFGLADGLADNKNVTVLDFACGTGTFLLEVFQRAFENIGGTGAGRAGPMVREHLLKNIFGFEYLIAPYTIAHLKLSQYLQEQGFSLEDGERLQVFLTNTLEPVEPQKNLLLPAVTAEVEAAQQIKDEPILVITGNPPYVARSKNRGRWIRQQIKAYEYVDGKHFKERKHWLNDDYVKFLRFAQLKVDARGDGVVAVITNRWWIENVTFRGMRQSLLNTFDQIYIFDLNGEVGTPGDQNVFDITKGVAISIFVRKPSVQRRVRYASITGARIHKYETTASASLVNLAWTNLEPNSPNYFLVPRTEIGRSAYEQFASIIDIFVNGSTSILTARDRLAVAPTENELWEQLGFFASDASDAEVEQRFGLKADGHWGYSDARRRLATAGLNRSLIRPIAYRPFDVGYYYDDGEIVFRRRAKIMRHMLRGNLGLAVCRLTKGGEWRHTLVADAPTDDSTISDASKERSYLFPLYLLDEATAENFSPDFRAFIDGRYGHHYTPEEILGYIYAVLHAPTYRQRYAEFLKIDFPRIPFTEHQGGFDTLSALGWRLVQAHLLKSVPRKRLAQFHGQGSQTVEFVRYAEANQTVAINDAQRFGPIPPEVWNFHIGGHQVLDKYLKSRKGRTLSLDEINHVGTVADSLAFTVEMMAEIDIAYRAAFPAGENAG